MALGTGPFLVQESVNDGESLSLRVHAPADADELSVVVLACEAGSLLGPSQGTARTLDLVGGDLLTVAGAAEDYAQRARIINSALCRLDAECRVIILGIVFVGTAVDDLVSLLLLMLGNGILCLKTGVVCS